MTDTTIEVRTNVVRRSKTVPSNNFEGLPPLGEPDQFLGIDAERKRVWRYPPAGNVGDYDPGDITLIFENKLI